MPNGQRVQLFTTTDYANGTSTVLKRMLGSVEGFRARHPDVELRLRLLLQRMPHAGTYDIPSWVEVMSCADRISLSAARNRMLAAEQAIGIDPDTIVAFPDDDAWYPDGSLERIVQSFAEQPELDLWFCRYGQAASAPESVRDVRPTLQQTLSYASSNTTVVRARMIALVGGFDEGLGVGTPAGGGEDTDFAMRCWHQARRAAYCDWMAIGHRDTDPAIRAKYYGGSLRAIARNASASGAARLAWARKVAVGAAFAAMGRITPAQYLKALAAAHRR